MNRITSFISILVVAALAGYFGAALHPAKTAAEKKENAYEHVLRTGVLRCGYYVFPPALSIDANTKEKTGFAVDMTNEIASRLHLKVEWTEEVTFGTMMESLRLNHFDAICTPVWINAAQGRVAEYTRDLFYAPTIALVRADDTRFDNDLNGVNTPTITLATMDGDTSAAIATGDFPQAKTLSIPNNSALAQLFMNVADKKADMTFTDKNAYAQYAQTNPGKLKIAANAAPVRVFPFAYAVGKGQFELLSLLNYTLTEMLYAGQIERIVRKHELFPNSYLYINTPYRSP